MISDRAKALLSEGVFEDGERTIIFLEEGDETFAFRLFRATEGAGDPEQRAIQWLGRAKGMCRSARGEITTGLIRSKDGTNVMATTSGNEIEAREWPQEESGDSSRLSTTRAAR